MLAKNFVRFPIIFFLFQTYFMPGVVAQTTPEPISLESGKSVEREISGDLKHVYHITLSENQFAGVNVEQRGVDVVVRLIGADEKPLASFDSETWTKGTEKVQITAKVPGTYKLEVSASFGALPGGRYEIRLAEVRAAAQADELLQEARTAFADATKLRGAGKMKEAFTQVQRALEIRERVLGQNHTEIAATLDTLAFFYFTMGDYAKAESLLARALEIKEKNLEPEHPAIAQTLNSFGIVVYNKGDYARAETFLQRALQIREKSLGTEHPAVAGTLNGLANLYIEKADYARAEALYLRSLAIKEKTAGAVSTEVADAINNLALLSGEKGDYEKERLLYQRALEIYEKLLPAEHPTIARALNNLGTNHQKTDDFAGAEQLLIRALAIYEKTLGADNLAVAQTLYNLGTVYYSAGNMEKAEQTYKKALAIIEAKLGAENINLNFPLKALGVLYRNKGEYDKAEEILLRVLSIRKKTVGEFHPALAGDLESLALVYAAKGLTEKAVEAQTRAVAINERVIALNIAAGSERQKLAYLGKLSQSTDQIVSLQTHVFPDDAAARELALTTILQRKGRVQDAMADNFGKLRERLGAPGKVLFDKLSDANSQLAKLVLNAPNGISLAKHQEQIKTLEEEKEKLENEISRSNTEYFTQNQPATIATIRNELPKDAALIEFAMYRLFDPRARSKQKESGEARYVAYVIQKQGEIKWHDLGDAKTIDEAVKNFRQALRDPSRKDAATLARGLNEKIISPILNLLGEQTQIFISPDGALNLIPFEALVDEKNRYLVENYSFAYLTSGRDLMRMQTRRTASKSKSLIVANPAFGDAIESNAVAARRTKRQSMTATRNLSDTYFAPLGGTLQEARAIGNLFPDAQFLTDKEATETALKAANAPRILHIATHGFFLQDAENDGMKIENPLLRSGLALAGANKRRDGVGDDGILTALEASGLNLWGTKLVVLSACDTGLGEVKNGEGVYGLRRAFTLAGAETLMMSLWSVSDYTTRELMANYYKNLKSGMGRGAALRQVQLEMLRKKGREHPFYWAAFIQSGEWANLDGKR